MAGGEHRAEGCHLAGAEAADHPGAGQAGDHGPGVHDGRDHPAERHGQPEFRIDGRPGGAEERVRQAEADECDVDHGEKQGHHAV